MNKMPVIQRVQARNFRSIAKCDVHLGPLTWLVGPNGSGKSNFIDVLHFVKDALDGSIENALDLRGGLPEVRRRSSGRPNHFTIRIDLMLPGQRAAGYEFTVGARTGGAFEVQKEACQIVGFLKDLPGLPDARFKVESGRVVSTSESVFPPTSTDRLALVAAAGLPAFRPLFDILTGMEFYNLNPREIGELQKPQDGRALKSSGENIASVIGNMERTAPDDLALVKEYLRLVVPGVQDVHRLGVQQWETIEFRQNIAGSENAWKFNALSMSDGTLRALGILVSLFQSTGGRRPSLIAIEEPEIALHPAASAILRDALARASEATQVVVTSHSPELLNDDRMEMDHLLAVSSRGGKTEIAPVDESTRQAVLKGLYTPGELLALGQLEPDPEAIVNASATQPASLFDTMK